MHEDLSWVVLHLKNQRRHLSALVFEENYLIGVKAGRVEGACTG